MIKPCKCKHTYQDEVHGKGMRVHTIARDETERCTVCGPKARSDQRLELHAKEFKQK